MGGGSWSGDSYRNISSSYVGKATASVFAHTASRTIDPGMDPNGLTLREARDNSDHPNTVPVIVALDETGSMGSIPDALVREHLGKLMETLIDNKVQDATVLFMGIGDHLSDRFPLQVGQFESETSLLTKWLTGINLEGGGGGQHMESYLLAWLVAGRHTSTDSFEKRGKKGFLFTIGDESNHPKLEAHKLKSLLGYKEATDVTDEELLTEAQRQWHVFHIHCQQGSYPNQPDIMQYWKEKLGERFIKLDDYHKLCEVMAATVASLCGASLDDVTAKMSPGTALMVRDAVSAAIAATSHELVPGTGVVEL